jgi:hypothetical protein
MAKRQSFADKANKKSHAKVCPVCNATIEAIRIVDPTYRSDKKSWKFGDRMVEVCKCNEKEVFA